MQKDLTLYWLHLFWFLKQVAVVKINSADSEDKFLFRMDEFDADVIYTESDEIERLSTTQSIDITIHDPVIVRGAGTTTL